MKIVKVKPRVGHMISKIDVKVIATVVCSVCISQALSNTHIFGGESINNARIFRDVSPSVFKVTSIEYMNDPFSPGNASKKINGTGTGFMYRGKDYVITNAHVVLDSMKVKVDDMDAEIVGVDTKRDIALLKLDVGDRAIKPLQKCIDPASVGDTVLALGNPLGFEKSLTSGIVSGIDRSLSSETSVPLMQLIQTDASINPGNSGGPLLSGKDGCVLGVNTALVSPGTGGGNAGLGFAIPMEVVDQIIDNIINQGEQKEEVALGVSLLPDIYSDGLGVDGVIIANVFPGGLGEQIGLQGTYRDVQGRPNIGDIILEINGKKIEKLADVYVAMQKVVKGELLSLKILKFEGVVDVTVQT